MSLGLPGPAARSGAARARRSSTPCSTRSRSRHGEARGYLARFLFRGDDAFKEVRSLSGGERSRLELALLGIQPSNLLLLDEPTNHLDIPAREAIEAFMRESPATLLVVSHDRRLLETVCDRLWVVGDGAGRRLRRWLSRVARGRGRRLDRRRRRRGEADARAGRPPAAAPAAPAAPAVGRADDARLRRTSPGAGRATVAAPGAAEGPRHEAVQGRLRRQKAALDAELTRLGLRKNHLELALGDPAVGANFVELRRVTSELADVDAALAAAEDAWLELEERAP